jgi:hypothetical protein
VREMMGSTGCDDVNCEETTLLPHRERPARRERRRSRRRLSQTRCFFTFSMRNFVHYRFSRSSFDHDTLTLTRGTPYVLPGRERRGRRVRDARVARGGGVAPVRGCIRRTLLPPRRGAPPPDAPHPPLLLQEDAVTLTRPFAPLRRSHSPSSARRCGYPPAASRRRVTRRVTVSSARRAP